MNVSFESEGRQFVARNPGPLFKGHTEASSFVSQTRKPGEQLRLSKLTTAMAERKIGLRLAQRKTIQPQLQITPKAPIDRLSSAESRNPRASWRNDDHAEIDIRRSNNALRKKGGPAAREPSVGESSTVS